MVLATPVYSRSVRRVASLLLVEQFLAMSKQARWQLWGKEPGDTEQVFLAEYLQKEWAEEAKQQAEQSGIRDVEIRKYEPD